MEQIHQMISAEMNSAPAGEMFVVGLGASAGGLEALQQFFCFMPPNSGLSFVVVQHLAPDYKSLMRRYDARNFSVAEYAVEYTEGEGRVLMSTLNFGGGCGEQPSGFTQNKLAVKLLCDWITYLEGEQI